MRRQRYSTYDSGEREDVRRVHPIWNGIGCLLIVIIPTFFFLLSHLLLDANAGRISLPAELMNTVNVYYLGEVNYFNAKVLATVVLSFAGYLVLAFIYSLMYFASGQTMSGPMDAPPVRRKISQKGNRSRYR